MAENKPTKATNQNNETKGAGFASSPVENLLLAALERGDDSFQTGRYLVTFKEGAAEKALQSLGKAQGMRIADARDFEGQAMVLDDVGDADAVVFSEVGVALVGGEAAQERSMDAQATRNASDSPLESMDPEYFVFADSGSASGYMQSSSPVEGAEIGNNLDSLQDFTQLEEEVQVLGATWGLIACKVPPSARSGAGIKVAVLDSGMDLGHPDFAGRSFTTATFVGQPVHDLYGHGTHMVGTACGPNAPAGAIPRYGIGYKTSIFVGKILSNSGTGTTAGILAGMNWAIANRCAVILVPVSGAGGPFPAYTAAGQAALNNGCLIVAGSSSSGPSVGAPANSPTIMSAGAVNQNLQPAPFSPAGKIDIAAPGVNIFSSYPRPRLYNTWSGLASAAAHVAGCAALWAETSPNLRGASLWKKLEATARRYPPYFPPYPPKHARLGAGLVQAP